MDEYFSYSFKNGLHGLHSIIEFLMGCIFLKNIINIHSDESKDNKDKDNDNKNNKDNSNIDYYIKQIQTKYKLFSNIDFTILKDGINKINIDKIDNYNNSSLLDCVFSYYLENENLIHIKEYFKYYNDKRLVEWIINFVNPIISSNKFETIFDGNVKINSFLENITDICSRKNINWENKIYGNQTNNLVNDLIKTHFLINNKNINIDKRELLFEDISPNNKMFDLIFMDIPDGVHNIIHANCCQKIKKLLIRGTKSEPLFLQLVMSSLNKNGRALLIVPDSFLFSDSKQPVQTRKYLLDNFNVKKIVKIDEDFYKFKGVRNSILYFENNGTTTEIEFSNLTLDNEKCVEKSVLKLSKNTIIEKYCSLYYKNYEEIKKIKVENKMVDELFDIKTNFPEKSNKKMLGLLKYHKNNSIQIIHDNKNEFDFYFVPRDISDEQLLDVYLISYLEFIIKNNYEQLIKGKTKAYDIDEIKKIKIPLLSLNKQESIINYINVSIIIIENNNKKIDYYNIMFNYICEMIPINDTINIGDVCEIMLFEDKPVKMDEILIGILRNGLGAGTIYLVEQNNIEQISNNSYYLRSINNSFNTRFLYYYLKYIENKIKEFARLTKQPNLTKNMIHTIMIPKIPLSHQDEIIKYGDDFFTEINKLIESNLVIKNKDIMSIINKIY
jgi:hypothetical protein